MLLFSPAVFRHPGYRFFCHKRYVRPQDGPVQLHDYDRMKTRLRHTSTPQKRRSRRRRFIKRLTPLVVVALMRLRTGRSESQRTYRCRLFFNRPNRQTMKSSTTMVSDCC